MTEWSFDKPVDPFWTDENTDAANYPFPGPLEDKALTEAMLFVAECVAEAAKPTYLALTNNKVFKATEAYDGVLSDWHQPSGFYPFVTLHQLAGYVSKDRPMDLYERAFVYLSNTGATPRFNLLPEYNKSNGQFFYSTLFRDWVKGVAPVMVNPETFARKYQFKVRRPQMVAKDYIDMLDGVIASETAEDEAKKAAKASLKKLNSFISVDRVRTNPGAFTLIPGVCPQHWSYPAMHSTNAGAMPLVMNVFYDLTGAQLRTLQAASQQNAFARTFLGVHTMEDNLAGLSLGQDIALGKFPKLMAETFGTNNGAVTSVMTAAKLDYGKYTGTEANNVAF